MLGFIIVDIDGYNYKSQYKLLFAKVSASDIEHWYHTFMLFDLKLTTSKNLGSNTELSSFDFINK